VYNYQYGEAVRTYFDTRPYTEVTLLPEVRTP
jgi:hypothetical protein